MIEHIALGIAIGYAAFYWWRWSKLLARWEQAKQFAAHNLEDKDFNYLKVRGPNP